ncbi:MAG TPA: chemotaxis protein CheW [archaeon]|nr:chemotaxis protein CheW [archaeon]
MAKNRVSSNEKKDCWNTIGIHGDTSCPELEKVIHCHNCPVYSQAGRLLFERQLSADYLREWTELLSGEKETEAGATVSFAVFRIGREQLAVQALLVKEVTELKIIHSIPHLTNKILTGLVNIHGKIQLCFSLAGLLGLEREKSDGENPGHKVYKRMIVLEWEGASWVFPVDEIYGIYRFQPEKLSAVPETVSRSHSTYTKGIISLLDKKIGCLDHELLFNSLKRSIL